MEFVLNKEHVGREIKVKPASRISKVTIDKMKPDEDLMCFCRIFTPLFTIMRFALFFPVSWHHEEKCTFKISFIWSIYTLIGIGFFTHVIVTSTNYTDMLSNKPTLVYLNDITNAVYGHYVLISLIVTFLKIRKFLQLLRSTANMDPELLCASARVRTCQLQCFGIFIVIFILGLDAASLTYLNISQHRSDSGDSTIYRAMQNFPFLVYLMHTSFISCVDAGLTCFEKAACNSLGYEKLYPNLDVNEDNNNRKLLFIINYKVCNGDHNTHERFREMSSAEVVQHLRSKHESLCKRIDTTNDAGKPFFLVHTATELAVLIVRWYAIVTYVIHDLSGPANDAIHCTNCTFVALHTAGLIYFLSTIHRLKSMVETMKIILLEYCTRITDEDTFLQIRLFLEKLEQHRIFTANGVFEVDLKVATSIFTNILTYVLVALQFEISDS